VGYDVESIFGSVRTGPGASITLENCKPGTLNTGKTRLAAQFKTMLWSPLLVTGGDILFAGGTPDRLFRAFDARTANNCGAFLCRPAPSVFHRHCGRREQYVAVTTGWDLDARGVQNGLDKINGTKTAVTSGRHHSRLQAPVIKLRPRPTRTRLRRPRPAAIKPVPTADRQWR